MKMMKKILSIFVSAVIMFTSVLLTAFFTFADDTLNYINGILVADHLIFHIIL